jgi:hypothetical protein
LSGRNRTAHSLTYVDVSFGYRLEVHLYFLGADSVRQRGKGPRILEFTLRYFVATFWSNWILDDLGRNILGSSKFLQGYLMSQVF